MEHPPIKRIDKKGKFISLFNPNTGFYVRSGVIENGSDTGIDPFMASFPELIDIGVMGTCKHGGSGLCVRSGVQCYQNGLHVKKDNMTLLDFKHLIDQCAGQVFQVALGGRGDPNEHEYFEEMLSYCRTHSIVPNYTTSGYGLTEAQADISKIYCGAVAVSWYRSEYTLRALHLLLKKGVKTNIHFVISNKTIQYAIDLLHQGKMLPEGVNAIIFLLHH